MSYDLTAKILRRYLPGVSGIDKAVLASIADMIGDAGYCYPSYATLAARTGFSKRTIIRSIDSLYGLGLISKEQAKNKSNKYRVIQENLDSLIIKGKKILKSSVSKSPQGGLSDTSSGDSKAPAECHSDTLINKGKNNKKKIKNGATHSEIAEEHSAQVGEMVGEENEEWLQEASENFLEKVKKQNPLVVIENPSLPDDSMMIISAVDLAEDMGLMVNTLPETTKGKFTSQEMECILNQQLPLNPKEGQLMIDDQANVFAYHSGWWQAATHEEKANMKVEDVLQMPIKKNTKKPTIKPTVAMVWQWAVSEWLTEKGKKGNVDLTHKKKGQLNKAAKKINQAGFEWRPPIEFCVKHWLDFTTFVTKATGKQNYPAQPDIDYFLFHVNHVIGFWKDGIDTKIKKPKIKITKEKLSEKELKKLTPVEKYNLEHGD